MIAPPSLKPRLTSLEVRKSLEGGLIIGVVSKRTYQIRGSACELAPEQEPLVEEPVLTESGLVEHDSDRILQRQLVDVVVHGKARAPAPAASFTASVQIDGARRDLAVFGRRTLRLQASGAIAISAPEPIAEVDLTWQNAYGGVDRVLLANEGDPLIQLAEALGELRHFHPQHAVWRWQLSPERPRVAYRLGKERPVELDAKIRSLCIQPDARKHRRCSFGGILRRFAATGDDASAQDRRVDMGVTVLLFSRMPLAMLFMPSTPMPRRTSSGSTSRAKLR
jgi:hypothetical protein